MTETEISPGETVELIPGHDDEQANREYVVHIRKGVVSLSHSHQYAKDGAQYSGGDEGHLKNLGGRAIYAHAHDEPAVIEMDTDRFLFDLFGTKTVERPNDKASQENNLLYRNANGSVAAGATTDILSIPNNQNRAFEVAYAGLGIRTGDYDDALIGYLAIEDENGDTVLGFGANLVGWPLDMDPQPTLEPDWTAIVRMENHTSAAVETNANLIFSDPNNPQLR